MKGFFKALLWTGLVLGLLAAFAGFHLWQQVASGPGISISINGQDLDLQGLSAAPWMSGLLGLMVTAMVLCIVLPLVLMLVLGLPLLLVGLVLAGVLLSLFSFGALLFSPLLLLGLLLWWLLRRA